MNTRLYNFARGVNHKRKELLWQRDGKILSSVRRIERVHPIPGKRVVAMTFDDGPCAKDFAGTGMGLTAAILDILAEYKAHATFDVIGTTEGNYPDTAGDIGTPAFGGIRYDHYPCFGEDTLGGVVHNSELVKRIIAEGHELANHSYRHRLFGVKHSVYSARIPLVSLADVRYDLCTLHTLLSTKYSYDMRLARPPHYVDRVAGGASVYDAYRSMGYQYLAASYDGGGWQPGSSYEEEVEQMVGPFRRILQEDEDALNGQIIFQKDGCNMNLRTPVLDALPQQLELLARCGYEVVTVSSLIAESPFLDLAPDSQVCKDVRSLLSRGHVVGYRNNTFHGERDLTCRELELMLSPSQSIRDLGEKCVQRRRSDSVAGNQLLEMADKAGVDVDSSAVKDLKRVRRDVAVPLIAAIVRKQEPEEGSYL